MKQLIITIFSLSIIASSAWADNGVGWVITTHKDLQVGVAAGPFSVSDCQERAQDLENRLNDNAKLPGIHEWRHAKCIISKTEPLPER